MNPNDREHAIAELINENRVLRRGALPCLKTLHHSRRIARCYFLAGPLPNGRSSDRNGEAGMPALLERFTTG